MNNSNTIKLGRARNNFRTTQYCIRIKAEMLRSSFAAITLSEAFSCASHPSH